MPLSKLFKQSMLTGKLPQDWATAIVFPIFTKSDPCLSSNYKPISLTSIIVKVMERIIIARSCLPFPTTIYQLSDCQHNMSFHRFLVIDRL